ncbi:hypothetical protein KR026_008862, partial [Drosophila bipectinata]
IYLKMAWLFVILCKIFLLLQGVTVSLQKDREFVLDNKNLYYDCEKMPPGFVTEDNFIDRSKMTFVKDDNGAIHISGNGTVVWDIQSTDRVEVNDQTLFNANHFPTIMFQLDLSAFKQERGKWKPTPYKTTIKDFCKFLYEKNQPHYSYSIAHVTNKDYTKERCLTPGVNQHKPF